jgi:mRNA-degrading endonuclease toxin of MazEF toxin-antitoxin module
LSAAAWTPWPKPGDIVDCRFPEVVGKPGPKERPALVLQVEENPEDAKGCVVVVAYATSQKTEHVYAGEFVIAAGGVSGLTKDTKFDLVNTHALPFDAVWFGPAANRSPSHPKRGRLDLADMEIKRRLHAAVVEAIGLRKEQASDS